MADSFIKYTGGNTPYNFSKPHLRTTDVKVEVNGAARTDGVSITPSTAYPYAGSSVELDPDAGGSDVVKIYRDTDVSSVLYKDFSDGSVLKAVDLDDIQRYLLFVSQEKAEATKDYDGALPLGDVRQIVAGAYGGSEMAANTTTTYKRSAHRISATPKSYSSTWLVWGNVNVLVASETSSAVKNGFILKLYKDDSAALNGAQSGGTQLGPMVRTTDRHAQESVNTYYTVPVIASFTTSNRTAFTIDVFARLFDTDAGTSVLSYGATDRTQLYAVEVS